jgi:hypothetical protein
MVIGETVRFVSDHGEITITFDDKSPFRSDNLTGTVVPSGVILTLVKSSTGHAGKTFKGKCSLAKAHPGVTPLWNDWGVEFPVGHPKQHNNG